MQYWMLSKAGEIRRDEACLDFSGTEVVLYPCHGSKGNQVSADSVEASRSVLFQFQSFRQFWSYDINTNQLRHGSSDKCLAIEESKDKVVMVECSNSKENQKWRLENYDPTKL